MDPCLLLLDLLLLPLFFLVFLFVLLLQVWWILSWPLREAWLALTSPAMIGNPATVVPEPDTSREATKVPWWDTIEAYTNNDPKVVLMGDSVLDNFIWLKNPRRHLRVVLEEDLERDPKLRGMRCVNLAVDQMTTFDFITRNPAENSWDWYARAKLQLFPSGQDRKYPVASDGKIHSISNLKQLQNVRCVVVSVGGNDVYLSPSIQGLLGLSLLPFLSCLRTKVGNEFRARLSRCLASVQAAAPGALVVPIIVYHPHHSFSISGFNWGCCGLLARTIQRLCLPTLVSPLARQFLTLAQYASLPVIDLSRTMDPTNRSHYGTEELNETEFVPWSGAEPSNISVEWMSSLILYVIKNHDPELDGSKVYHGVVDQNRLVAVRAHCNISDFPRHYVFGRHGGLSRYRPEDTVLSPPPSTPSSQ